MKIVYILAAILIFGLLIAVHEFGHFITAKLCGVKVNEFSIGMGPLLWQKQKGETEYSLRLLPIGGYCAMEGEDEDTGDSRSFVRQPLWKKFVILVAGTVMNFLTGLIIVLVLFAGAGGFYVDQLAGFAEGFPLEGEDGLMVGDIIYKVDGYRTYLRGDTSMFLSYNDGQGVDLEVIRNGEHFVLEDFPMYRRDYDGTGQERFGISIGAAVVPGNFVTRLQYSWYQALDYVQLVWFSLVQLVTGNVGIQEMGGPVMIMDTIAEVGAASETAALAVRNIASIAALIAVNLAVMNLLPIPGLDGGRIFFLAVDAVSLLLFKRKVPEKYQAAINMVGMVALLGFMLLITVKDVFQVFQ